MKLISSVEKYKNNLFSVTEDRAIDPDGFEIKRGIVQHRGSAVMMAVDERKRILLVRQYRLPARQSLWELPAGSLDEGEKPLQGAKRELKEETGCRAKTWKKLVSFYPSPGFVAEKMTIYLATGLTHGEATPMDDERIETRWFPAREVERMILANEIMDAKTMIGYFLWKRQTRELRTQSSRESRA
jgi:ADP-ribose pyrophosphatase